MKRMCVSDRQFHDADTCLPWNEAVLFGKMNSTQRSTYHLFFKLSLNLYQHIKLVHVSESWALLLKFKNVWIVGRLNALTCWSRCTSADISPHRARLRYANFEINCGINCAMFLNHCNFYSPDCLRKNTAARNLTKNLKIWAHFP